MTKLENIETAVATLSTEERARLRAWLDEFDEQTWDDQIERDAFLAYKGYDSDALIATLEARGVVPVIPPKANRRAPRKTGFGLYRERNLDAQRQARQHIPCRRRTRLRTVLAQLTTRPSVLIVREVR